MIALLLSLLVVSFSSTVSLASVNQDGGFDSGKQQPQASLMNRLVEAAKQQQHQHRSLQITDGDEEVVDTNQICRLLERSFDREVKCECVGSLFGFFTMSCEYVESVCNANENVVTATTTPETTREAALTTCGRPILATSIVDGNLFSSTSCIYNYTRGSLSYQDTCVTVQVCPDADDGLCDCTASYNSQVCQECQVCEGGRGVAFDCTNVNAEIVSDQCSMIDLDLDLSTGGGHLAGFVPSFHGFCSELESHLDNRVTCDCSEAVGGSFSLTCRTDELECRGPLCANVTSSVEIDKGVVHSVTACTDYEEPFGTTCTALQFCPDESDRVCACVATYNGKQCKSCEICPGEESVKLDCSDHYEYAVIDTCQTVTARQSFEFIPLFHPPPTPAPSSEPVQMSSSFSLTLSRARILWRVLGAVIAGVVVSV